MKRLTYIFILTLVLVSCGQRSGSFRFEGRLLNLNQGEFYVYSPDGVFDGIDTIKVDGGRFVFETPCKEEGTLVIVFPNFSEQPVFAEPGKSVTVKGDASHLKEIEIEGTDANKLMNGFRQQIAKASPPDVLKYAEKFIKNKPQSIVSVYLLRRYFLTGETSDLDLAEQLVNIVHEAQPKNGNVARMSHYIRTAKACKIGSKLPQFKAKDLYDKNVSEADLKGKVAVVYTWADWNGDSRALRNRLNLIKKDHEDKLVLLGISLDGSRENCKRASRGDSVSSITVCDQMMFESPLIERFAFGGVAENVLFNAQGRVIERNLTTDELEKRLQTLLN